MEQARRIVSQDVWIEERSRLLAAEKELTRQRDQLSQQRRALPWVKVAKDYRFTGPAGPLDLGALFGPHSQLLIYHFMLGPDWQEGCKSCSFWADNFNGIDIHLAHRDVSLALVSRAPLANITSYAARMGWSLPWYSSLGSDFNFDYQVSFTEAQVTSREKLYNFGTQPSVVTELPGMSVFTRDPDGAIYHTYSCYSRGLDMMNAAYHCLDLTPKGRDEEGLPFSMSWLRRRDQYED